MDDPGNFNTLKPWPTVAERDREVLSFVYRHSLESDQPLTGRLLRFETGCTREDVSRLNKHGLLRGGDDRMEPTVLGLLYVSEAEGDLALIDTLLRLAHEHYRPTDVLVPFSQLKNRGLGAFRNPRLRALAAQVSAVLDEGGNLRPSEANWERPTLREAFLHEYRYLFRDDSDEGGQVERLAALPFAFRLTRVHATRFRALAEVSLELNPLTVLVGPNGVGKSTVLDTLAFLRTATNRSLAQAVGDEGGMDRLRTRGSEGPVRLGVEFTIDHGHGAIPCQYEISFDALGAGLVVESETLHVGSDAVLDKRRGQTFIHEPNVSQTNRLESPAVLGLATAGASGEFPVLAGVRRALGQVVLVDRDPVVLEQNDWAAAFGRGGTGWRARQAVNLSEILAMIAADGEALGRLSSVVTALLPNIHAIEATTVTAGKPDLSVWMAGVDAGLRLDELSSGTRQILLYAALYAAPITPRVVLVEEPDAGVHPGGHAALVHLLRSLSQKCIVIATTHSPSFVARLSAADEVKAMAPTDGGPRIDALADVIRSKRWLQEFDDTGEAFARGTRKS